MKGRMTGLNGKVSLAGSAFFFAACLSLHWIQPDLSPIEDAVSYYMNGSRGWILSCGLIALGIGSLSLAYGLHLTKDSKPSRAGLMLLAIWGIGAIVGGVFAPDPRGQWNKPPSISGLMHGGAAMVAFVVFPIAALLLSRNRSILLRILSIFCAVSLLVFFYCLSPVFSHHAPYALGLVERILLALYVAWITTAALTTRSA